MTSPIVSTIDKACGFDVVAFRKQREAELRQAKIMETLFEAVEKWYKDDSPHTQKNLRLAWAAVICEDSVHHHALPR